MSDFLLSSNKLCDEARQQQRELTITEVEALRARCPNA